MNAFEACHVGHQVLDHQVCAIQLLHQKVLLIVTGLLLPLDEGPEHGTHTVVLT
jgi:hypothetical protein